MTFFNRAAELTHAPTSPDALSGALSHAPGPRAAGGLPEAGAFADLSASITAEDRAFWCMMAPRARPSFTVTLLDELLRVQEMIRRAATTGGASPRQFDYVVLGSDAPGVFNLGGDLAHFAEKIRNRERDELRRYGHACCEVAYANYSGYGQGLITVGLVEGEALGGGWESALSCDVLVAERRARFGLPEILFNLFPGMGAYSFLSRRVGAVKAEELIMSGRIYSAEEMHALGLVHVLAEDGQGRKAVRAWIAANKGKRNAHAAIYQVRRRVDPVTLQELRDVVDIWVDTALALTEHDLRKMVRIAAAQDRFRDRGQAAKTQAA